MTNEILQKINKIGIIPVVKLENPDDAPALGQALVAGGLPIAEITFRTEGAAKAIKLMADACPDVLVGAGTVISIEQAKAAKGAGAKFVVSPGINPKVVAYCNEIGMPIVPGCTTASEIEIAMELGLEAVKFFPAEQSGGLSKLKALSGPYDKMRFIPTGGIELANLNEYLAFDRILACGGSFMVKEALLKNQQWDKVTELCRQAVDTMLAFEMGHVGINGENEEEALATARLLGTMLNLPVKAGNSSIFTGSLVEVMKTPYLGKHGHIGIKTNSVFRTKFHLENRGIRFNESSAKLDDKGNLIAIYIEQEIGGFALHFCRK